MTKRGLPPEIMDILGGGAEEHHGPACPDCEFMDSLSKAQHANLLRSIYELRQKPSNLKVGDIVTWKANMRHLRHPEVGLPAVVVEVLSSPHMVGPEPIVGDAGQINVEGYRPQERCDVILGMMVHGKYEELYFESARFRLWTAQDEVAVTEESDRQVPFAKGRSRLHS